MRTIARMLCLLAALVSLAAVAHAQGNTTAAAPPSSSGSMLTSIEAMSSTVMQRHQSSFSGLGLRGKVRVPQLIEGFSLMPTMEYWRNQSTISTFGIQSTRKDASLGAVLRYDFKRQGWQPYVGAGIGMHFLSSEVNAPTLGLDHASDSVIKGGLSVLGGVDFALAGRLGNLLELEYHQLSDQSQLKINWGLTVSL